jgi:hypothetical protein
LTPLLLFPTSLLLVLAPLKILHFELNHETEVIVIQITIHVIRHGMNMLMDNLLVLCWSRMKKASLDQGTVKKLRVVNIDSASGAG